MTRTYYRFNLSRVTRACGSLWTDVFWGASLLTGVFLLASCSTTAVIKTSDQLVGKGNYGEAYTNIVRQLQKHPGNKSLLEAKSRIGELFAQDLVNKEASAVTNHLVERIHLLETAA